MGDGAQQCSRKGLKQHFWGRGRPWWQTPPVIQPGSLAHEGEQVRIAGPTVRLKPKAAETFGLAVHELATNAVKHGALSVPQGRIRISWRVQNGSDLPWLVFEWKESGMPERAAKRKRRG